MEIFNQEFIQEIIRLTWRNPAFMAVAIALVWLIPQLFIRKIMSKKYERRKIELQKETGCPDSFIYDFVGKIQNEWHPKSCHSIVRNKKRKN